MVVQKSWEEFRASGLLWWINQTLHLFGWAIVVEVELDQDGKPTDEIAKVYPARVKFRGFDAQSTEQGYITLTHYLKKQIEELTTEVDEDPSPGILIPDVSEIP